MSETCPQCGWWIKICKCSGLGLSLNINTDGGWAGWYEHLDLHPVYIKDKKHLIIECEKRGLYSKALMKPKSQGKGYEHKWR